MYTLVCWYSHKSRETQAAKVVETLKLVCLQWEKCGGGTGSACESSVFVCHADQLVSLLDTQLQQSFYLTLDARYSTSIHIYRQGTCMSGRMCKCMCVYCGGEVEAIYIYIYIYKSGSYCLTVVI